MVDAARPVSLKTTTPAPTVAIWVNDPPVEPVARSILNIVSLFELSTQDNEMLVLEAEMATRLEGAAGSVVVLSVVALATFEKAESPAPLLARTR